MSAWMRSKLLWVSIVASLIGAAIREILLQLFGV